MKSGIAATVLVVGGLVLGLVMLNSGFFGKPQPSPSASPELPPSRVSVRPATPLISATPRPSPTAVDNSVVASGVVVPERSADLATSAAGIVDSVYVREGDETSVGQLLVKLDQTTYQSALNTANGEVDAATARVAAAQVALDELPPDASPGQVEAARAALSLAEAELELWRTRVSEAQTALEHTVVRAPFAGTVAEVSVEVGEQAVAGQTVVTLGDMTQWLIETTDLSELEVVRVAVGDRATVNLEALPDVVLTGTVDRIQLRGTTADGGVLFAVAIRPDTTHPRLRWNMSATVRITPSG